MSSPDPRAHDRSDFDHSEEPSSAKGKAIKRKMKKSSKYDAMINPKKAHPNSPLGKLHGLLNN